MFCGNLGKGIGIYGTSKKKVSLGKDTLLDPGAVKFHLPTDNY